MIFNMSTGGASTADKIKYDNTESGLQSTDVQGAIDEVNSSLNDVSSGLQELWGLIFTQLYPDGLPLIPTMTSNTTPSGEVTYNGYIYTGNPYNAFDNSDTTVLEFENSTANWIQYKFENPVCVSKFGIDAVDRRQSNYISIGVRVKNITLQASNDGESWVDLVSATTVNDTSVSMQSFNFKNNESYLYYRFNISGTHATNTHSNVINQLQLYRTTL